MKSSMRKMLALLLSAVFCVCLIPAAFAEGETAAPEEIAFPEPEIETLMETVSFDAPESASFTEADTFDALPVEGCFVIPTGTTAIEEEAFSGCVGMTSVKIPAGVKSIGNKAFYGCSNLSAVYYEGTSEQWKKIAVGTDNAPLRAAVISFNGDLWVPISQRYFPDSVFRNFVSSRYDTDKNGYLSNGERFPVTSINCSGTEQNPGSIRSLKGIELFPNLKGLYCAFNELTALDVSRNKSLELLYCSNNALVSLDLSGNELLKQLYCSNNNISWLDFSMNQQLQTVYAHYNNLTSLDVSRNGELGELYVAYNKLSSLNLRSNTKLRGLEILGNRFSTLDLSANTIMEVLHCGKNELRSLTVVSSRLVTLDCHDNNLTSLNLSRTTALEQLNCSGNRLTSLDISSCPVLQQVTRTVTPYRSNGIVYYYVDKDSPYLIYDDSSPSPGPSPDPSGVPINSANFPDPTFRKGVSEFYDKNKDGYLSASEIRAVTLIDCNNLGIQTLKGIEYFVYLKTLRVYGNPLSMLDISTLTELQEFVCYNTRISTLDVRNNRYLSQLVRSVAPYEAWVGAFDCLVYQNSVAKLVYEKGIYLYA